MGLGTLPGHSTKHTVFSPAVHLYNSSFSFLPADDCRCRRQVSIPVQGPFTNPSPCSLCLSQVKLYLTSYGDWIMPTMEEMLARERGSALDLP